MDDALVRLTVVLGAVSVAVVFSVVIRMRSRGQPREVKDHGLSPGAFLFTSSACQGCSTARRAVREALGENGYVELSWESDPGEFHRLGVGAVPATIVVSEDGSATLYPGSPSKALQALSP